MTIYRDITPAHGDKALTRGSEFVWYKPWTWALVRVFYPEVRRYQREQYPGCDDGWVHVRTILWKDGRWQFFEFTYPTARWGELSEITGKYKIVRYAWPLQSAPMVALADKYNGSKYDMGDNLDMLFSQKLGLITKIVRVFGDKLRQTWNCSMGAAEIAKAGGAMFEREAISPAYYDNTPESWFPIEEGEAT
jgi:hypothetical protein